MTSTIAPYIEIKYYFLTCLINENNRLLLQVKLQRYSCVNLSDPNGSLWRRL